MNTEIVDRVPASEVSSADVSLAATTAYAAPIAGLYFFYIPMWSILPGIYAKYFGLKLTAVASVVLVIRIFDGILDTTVGYFADLHRSHGGSRKPWVIVGGLGSIAACYFLFNPPHPVTPAHYMAWSLVYFLALTTADIPHLAWGSELTLDYQNRAQVYGVRNIMSRLGTLTFYALPLLPLYASSDYTPRVLQDAIYIGATMTAVGLSWAILAAPTGFPAKMGSDDSLRLFVRSLALNKPLLLYFGAFGLVGLCYGMWFGLLYFYLDTYLGLGGKVAIMFLVAFAVAALSTPLWLTLIRRTDKSVAWCLGVLLFVTQLIGMWFVTPVIKHWWIPFGLVIVANVCFCCHDIAALAILGDIVDYGKLKFRKDRGSTYFALNALVFKFGLGIGGGLALGIAGLFDFDPLSPAHSAKSIFGLKLGFIGLPICFAILGLFAIWRTPIDRRRHGIIRRRIESRATRSVPKTEQYGSNPDAAQNTG